jgi:hypothetical protein
MDYMGMDIINWGAVYSWIHAFGLDSLGNHYIDAQVASMVNYHSTVIEMEKQKLLSPSANLRDPRTDDKIREYMWHKETDKAWQAFTDLQVAMYNEPVRLKSRFWEADIPEYHDELDLLMAGGNAMLQQLSPPGSEMIPVAGEVRIANELRVAAKELQVAAGTKKIIVKDTCNAGKGTGANVFDNAPSGFSNFNQGQEAHANFESALNELYETQPGDWLMNTALGQTGVDAEFIGPASRHPGFNYAELKPYSQSGIDTFGDQLGKWGLPRGQTQLFFYNRDGIIGSSGFSF